MVALDLAFTSVDVHVFCLSKSKSSTSIDMRAKFVDCDI